jgi:hypothetical protein
MDQTELELESGLVKQGRLKRRMVKSLDRGQWILVRYLTTCLERGPLTALLNVSLSTVSSINLSAHFSPFLLIKSFAFLALSNRSRSGCVCDGPASAFLFTGPLSRVVTDNRTGLVYVSGEAEESAVGRDIPGKVLVVKCEGVVDKVDS